MSRKPQLSHLLNWLSPNSSDEFHRPAEGWISTVRKALGVSLTELSIRLGVNPSTVKRAEQSEIEDRISLLTLRRIANELECDLVYGFVPRKPLTSNIQAAAEEIAWKRINRVKETMDLEDQSLSPAVLSQLVEKEIELIINSGFIWKQT